MRLIKVKLALVDKDHYIASKTIADTGKQWESKLLSITPNKLAVVLDRSFSRCGFTLTIDDTDGTYKAMLAHSTNRKIYGKTVTVYAYAADGVTLADTIVASIKDFHWDEYKFVVECDQEFTAKMSVIPAPLNLVFNTTDWPNAHRNTLGKAVPMPEGVQSSPGGATTAYLVNVIGDIWVDWTTCRYVYVYTKSPAPPAASRVISVDSLFCEGVQTMPGGGGGTWVASRDANGWELITVSPPPPREGLLEYAPETLTVNGTFATESSGSQNPVGVLSTLLTDDGLTLVDDGDFAGYCTAQGWKHNGQTPENITTVKEYIETWAHNFNAWWRIASDGTIHIKHINWAAVTADAILTEKNFDYFKETAKFDINASFMMGFCNRILMSFNFVPTQSKYQDLLILDSVDGDYLPAAMPVEKQDENVMFAYIAGAAHPVTGQIKYYDHPLYTVAATISLQLYEQLALGLLKIVDATHYNQISGTGKYLVVDVAPDYTNETVSIGMIRLWGV